MSSGKKVDFLEKARAAWGKDVPDFVLKLAEDCQKVGQESIARRIGYNASVVSQVLANKYPGNMVKVEAAVRGALMGATVVCPIVGEIGRDQCLEHQRLGNTGASPTRAAIYRKCNGIGTDKCEHSLIRRRDDA
jgi:hypothetical protein